MFTYLRSVAAFLGISFAYFVSFPGQAHGCSTFKLQIGKELLYGHNLNQPGMDVPGQIFINKRGVFKIGRSQSDMLSKTGGAPSSLTWISRYGSVTFNTFGKDMPDGGINEAGLYIWEMSDETEYPTNDSLPRLIQMNWMQYVLDNCATTDEAVEAAGRIAIEGWGWHYFVGDDEGRCAAVEFIKGEPVVHRGDGMPVPALFNEPYAREMEMARYFRGFGGLYEPDLADKRVPRFVKTAVMIRDYEPSSPAAEYGLEMLDRIKVNEAPDWSVLIDVRRSRVYFKTTRNPEIKTFSTAGLDFSNRTPALILNLDRKEGGDVLPLFHPATESEIREFLHSLPLPDAFFSEMGLTRDEFADRFAAHQREAEDPARQIFRGTWTAKEGIFIELTAEGTTVSGRARNDKGEDYALDHLHLIGGVLSFTFRNANGTIYFVRASLDGDRMGFQLGTIDGIAGRTVLSRR